MSTSRTLLLLVLIAGLAALFLWFASPRTPTADAPPSWSLPVGAEDPTTVAPNASGELGSAGETARVERSATQTPPPPPGRRGRRLEIALAVEDGAPPRGAVTVAVLAEPPVAERDPQRTAASFYGALWRGASLDPRTRREHPRLEAELVRTQTDERGIAEALLDAEPGAVYVAVLDEDLEQTLFARHDLPAAPDEGLVTVRLDVPVIRATRVEGSVLDASGRPVEGADVLLRPAPAFDVQFGLRGLPPAARSTRTDAEGRYRFHGVAPYERYVLRAGARERGPAGSATSAEFAVNAGDRPSFPLRLSPGASLHGKVVDEQERPIAGASVYLHPFDEGTSLLEGCWDPTGLVCRSGPEGTWRADGLLPDTRYTLTAESPGHAPSDSRNVIAGAEEPVVLTLEVGQELRGTTRDADGAPLGGTRIRVLRALSQSTFTSANARVLNPVEVFSDADGAFRVMGLEAGSFDLHAESADGLLAATVRGARVGGKKAEERAPLEVVLVPRGRLTGTVVDADGEPVRRFTVQLDVQVIQGFVPATVARVACSSARGAFAVEGVEPGAYQLTVHTADRAPFLFGRVEVQVAGESVAIQLPPVSDVAGRVVLRESGRPVAGATVLIARDPMSELRDLMAGTSIATETDAEGRFRLRGLPVGEHTLDVRHDLYLHESTVPVTVSPGVATENVLLHLTSGAAVEGTVSSTAGAPIEGANVVAMWAFGMRSKATRTDAHGAYRIDGLPGGSLQVMAADLSILAEQGTAALMSALETKNVQAQTGSTTVVNFGGLRRGSTLMGVVRENGRPRKGVMLMITRIERADGKDASGQRFAATDTRGRYTFESLPEGKVELLVMRTSAESQTFQEQETISIPKDVEVVHDIDLASGAVGGRVEDETGRPVAGLSMSLHQETDAGGREFVAQCRTDSEGRYVFDGIADGTFTVRAGETFLSLEADERYGRAERTGLAVQQGRRLERVDFVLTRGGTLEGRVRDRGGEPLEGASIFVARADESWEGNMMQAVSLGAGRYRVGGLAPGAVKVRVRALGYVAVEKGNLWIQGDETTEVDFTLERGVRVVVIVEDDLGKPLTDFRVVRARLETPGGASTPPLLGIEELVQRFGGAVQSGSYELGSFAPGPYVLAIDAEGFAPLRQELQVVADPSFRQELRVRLRRP